MRRVLMLINETGLGGGQTHVLDLARGLTRAGSWCAEIGAAGGGPLEEAARAAGLAFHALPFDRAGAYGLLAALRARIRAGGYELVHTHGGIAGFWGRLAALGTGVRLVHTLHGIHYLHYDSARQRLAYRVIDRVFAAMTDRVICVCRSDMANAIAAGVLPAASARAVLNGIDVEQVEQTFARVSVGRDALRASLGIQPEHLAVVCVARYHRQKGLPVLIDAFAQAVAEQANLRLVLAGGGAEQPALEELARRLGVANRVTFWTSAGSAVAGGAYAAADLFCLPSLWEGLPLVVLEAWACGLPVIATAVDGTREIVRPGLDGLLVPVNDAKALSQAILDLARDPERAGTMGREGRSRVRDEFNLSRMVKETEQVYGELF